MIAQCAEETKEQKGQEDRENLKKRGVSNSEGSS